MMMGGERETINQVLELFPTRRSDSSPGALPFSSFSSQYRVGG
jgi:hypothetical protein